MGPFDVNYAEIFFSSSSSALFNALLLLLEKISACILVSLHEGLVQVNLPHFYDKVGNQRFSARGESRKNTYRSGENMKVFF